MKTTKSIFGTMAMSIVAMFLNASLKADVYLNVYPIKASKKVSIELSLPVQKEVSIFIFDNQGQPLYNETINKGASYKKIFDFSNLRSGWYRIVSESENLRITKTIEVNKSSVEVVSTKYFNRPVFTFNNDVLTINYMNINQSKIKISIEDPQRIYYKETLPGDVLFRKAFKLVSFRRGEYTVLLEADGSEFEYTFRKYQ